MITGFESITETITSGEALKADRIAKFLNANKGKVFSSKELLRMFDIDRDSTVRKMIHYIRMNDLCVVLVATSKGYKVTDNPLEVNDYVTSLDQRIQSTYDIRQKVVAQGISVLKSHLKQGHHEATA